MLDFPFFTLKLFTIVNAFLSWTCKGCKDVRAECSNKICSQTGQKLKTVQSRLCAHVTPNVNKNTNVVTWVFIRGSSGMLSL